MQIIYEGRRIEEGCAVSFRLKDRETRLPLNPRLDVMNHSPSGFEWGYQGSGPAQLALALLIHHYRATDPEGQINPVDLAFAHYQYFKRKVVSRLPHDGWKLTTADIRKALLHAGETLNIGAASR